MIALIPDGTVPSHAFRMLKAAVAELAARVHAPIVLRLDRPEPDAPFSGDQTITAQCQEVVRALSLIEDEVDLDHLRRAP